MIKLENISYRGNKLSDEESLMEFPEDLRALLRITNGFITFDGGLHIRGASDFPVWHSLQEVWFGGFARHKFFSSLKESDVPFGQDCFGDRFILRDEAVWRLYAETDDLENLDLSLNEFLSKAEENPVDFYRWNC